MAASTEGAALLKQAFAGPDGTIQTLMSQVEECMKASSSFETAVKIHLDNSYIELGR